MTAKLTGTIYTMKGESDEVNRVGLLKNTGNLVNNLAHYHGVTHLEMMKRLLDSDIEHPITYHDEIYWMEN